MKLMYTSFIIYEALVYITLVPLVVLLSISSVIYTVQWYHELQHGLITDSQVYNALTLMRRDLVYAPAQRAEFKQLLSSAVCYALPDNQIIGWSACDGRLVRTHDVIKQGSIIHDQALVLESVTSCLFTRIGSGDAVRGFVINLSHNGKEYHLSCYTRNGERT